MNPRFVYRTLPTLVPRPCRQPFNIADCADSVIALCDHSDMVQVDRVTRCRIFIGASCESVFLRNCADCEFTIAWCVGCGWLRTASAAASLPQHSIAAVPFPRLRVCATGALLPVSTGRFVQQAAAHPRLRQLCGAPVCEDRPHRGEEPWDDLPPLQRLLPAPGRALPRRGVGRAVQPLAARLRLFGGRRKHAAPALAA